MKKTIDAISAKMQLFSFFSSKHCFSKIHETFSFYLKKIADASLGETGVHLILRLWENLKLKSKKMFLLSGFASHLSICSLTDLVACRAMSSVQNHRHIETIEWMMRESGLRPLPLLQCFPPVVLLMNGMTPGGGWLIKTTKILPDYVRHKAIFFIVFIM